MHRDGVGLGRWQPGLVVAVHQQPPHVAERHPADQVLDVDTAVAQRRPLPVGLGDLGLESDDAFETVMDLDHAQLLVRLGCNLRLGTRSGSEPYQDPASGVHPVEAEPVVQAPRPTLPELDAMWLDANAAPVLRARHLRLAREPVLLV